MYQKTEYTIGQRSSDCAWNADCKLWKAFVYEYGMILLKYGARFSVTKVQRFGIFVPRVGAAENLIISFDNVGYL